MRYFFTIAILLFSLKTYSCSCAGMYSVSEKFSKADFVAKGKIIKNYKNKGEEETYKSDIKIDQIFKGVKVNSLLVYGNNGADTFSSCDIFIKEGTELIFYANKNYEGKLQIGFCSGLVYFKQVNKFKKELEILDILKMLKDKHFNKINLHPRSLSIDLKKFNGINLKKRFAIFEISFDKKLNISDVKIVSGFGNKNIDKKVIEVLNQSLWKVHQNNEKNEVFEGYKHIVDIYYYSQQGNNKSFLSLYNL